MFAIGSNNTDTKFTLTLSTSLFLSFHNLPNNTDNNLTLDPISITIIDVMFSACHTIDKTYLIIPITILIVRIIFSLLNALGIEKPILVEVETWELTDFRAHTVLDL